MRWFTPSHSFCWLVTPAIGESGSPSCQVADPSSKPLSWLSAAIPHIVWCTLVFASLGGLAFYGSIPGQAATAASQWPTDSTILPAEDTNAVLVFVHPQCFCTRATIDQLQRAFVARPKSASTTVVVYAPSTQPESWCDTSLVRLCKTLPGATVVLDHDGQETQRFGVNTSGHVLVFNRQKQLQFSGGVTPSRGHLGPCEGLDAVTQIIAGQKAVPCVANAYGCPLGSPESANGCGRAECKTP